MAGTETQRASDDLAVGGMTCPICGGSARRLLDSGDRNRLSTADSFTYMRCESCSTIFIANVPADLGRYYPDSYYQFDDHGDPLWRQDPVRIAAAEFQVDLLKRHGVHGHVVEVGANSGPFAPAAAQAGFQVTAIEMSEDCCDYLNRQPGITAICSDDPQRALEGLPSAQAVVMWHVLEHLTDPVAVLRSAAGKLLPGGVLAFAVPNPASLQFRVLKGRWMHLDAPRHLRLAPPEALVGVCEGLGLRLVEMTTADPDGRQSDLMGWINALNPPPALQASTWLKGQIAGIAWRLATPLERRGLGSAVTFAFRK